MNKCHGLMPLRFIPIICIFYLAASIPLLAGAQKNPSSSPAKKESSTGRSHLFDNDEILHFKLVGKLNILFDDRGSGMAYHPMLLQYRQRDSSLLSLKLMVKTRGHFRRLRENCRMPPLLLNFPKGENSGHSLFEKEGKLKLVVPCRGEEYIIREWLAYKIYNLITEKSFKARLVQVDFEDSLAKRKTETHYCILIEEENRVAERNKTFVWKRKMLSMKDMDNDEFKKMAVFQYMIGNTDWGVPYLQNIVLVSKDTAKTVFAIPYDFDHAGIVDAPYAGPAEELELPSVRTRLYRGYCESDRKNFDQTFELFNRLKKDIYDLYNNCALLKPKYIKYVNNYLDDFYHTINSKKEIEDEFQKPCKTDVRIELKGLKE